MTRIKAGDLKNAFGRKYRLFGISSRTCLRGFRITINQETDSRNIPKRFINTCLSIWSHAQDFMVLSSMPSVIDKVT